MNVFKGIIIVSLSLSLCNAENNQSITSESNQTIDNNFSYIDDMHKYMSETVLEWSDILDTTVSNWFDTNETNITAIDTNETNITAIDTNATNTIVESNTTARKTNTKTHRTAHKTNIPSASTVKTNSVAG